MTNNAVDLLNLIRGINNAKNPTGLRILTVHTVNPTTFMLAGTPIPLDHELFEIPASFQPLNVGDKFFTLPLIGEEVSQRWGLITRLNR